MSEENNTNVVKFLAAPAADSPQAEVAMSEEDHLKAALDGMSSPISLSDGKFYKYNVESIETIEDVKNFIREMDVYTVTYPGVSLESLGKNPDLWIEEDTPEELNEDTNI